MDDRKVCFIMCVNNEELAERCKKNLWQLKIPEGFTVDIQIVTGASGLAAGYDGAMRQSDAKYKVYLHQDVHILHHHFIADIVRLFSDYPALGILGTVGAKALPSSVTWWDAEQKYGKVIDSHTGMLKPLEFLQPTGDYESVEALDGLLLATQYDLPWRQDWFDGWHFYDASQCQEFIASGYEVGIPRQHLPWCLHDCGFVNTANGFAEARQVFMESYGYGKSLGKHQFHRLGGGCNIHPTCDLFGTRGISLGDGVKLQSDCWMMLPYDNYSGDPRIIIGTGSDIGRRCNLSAVNRIAIGSQVIISPNVHISDHNLAYQNPDLPIRKQGVDSWSHTVTIGSGSWIGMNTVIAGQVSIGKGCVIGAGSVVVSGTVIPDYCVAAGTPARVIKQYDPITRRWRKTGVSSDEEDVLPAEDPSPPLLLSICIPTYNREQELDICLNSIYSQNARLQDFEVIVSDNASPDGTQELVRKYQSRYSNLRYFRNERNEGADYNFLKCAGYAHGEFIKLHGDDDYWLPGSLEALCSITEQNRDCSLIFLDILRNSGQIDRAAGISNYVQHVSIYSTFMSGIIMRRKEFEQIPTPDLFFHSNLNQVYLEFSILNITPDYCVYRRKLLSSSGKITGGYSFAQTFINSYLNILNYFLDKGLEASALAAEKKHIAYTFLLWWYNYMLERHLEQLKPGDFEEIFTAAYRDEAYFGDLQARVKMIQAKHGLV
ncbi:glycosyltransferase [Paenibacillus sp. LMG 31459]|uniref:Glycosyltransferase n=1 Tax=Paenibacillus phytohabitans TaxID=2654978 RepID=A0ABX1YL14_9BACL|nr:glycosyltransferase [Paenibacillus phytohabitans]NOU81558.1 glycosyltransferase [Paenibacillus phytohabitans]